MKKIREKLKECRKLKDEYLAGWQRARADFINARKGEEKEREEFIRFAQKNIMEKLLALADNFDLAFANRDILPKDGGNWLAGMENTRTRLMKILEESGITPLENSLGKKFNPSAQEAIEKINISDPDKDNLVLEEVQRGYKMYDKILRPAKVKVGIYEKLIINN
ncbi:MAG: nucleotide exchange factor GrpE [Candidatus Niyogibacteria bacterium]|nr:nucleotide exchange factor GrpE [Candidatus Niyogibacteria bacterium]